MRTVSAHLVSCVMALVFMGCGASGSSSGTAEFSLNGSKHVLESVEFLVEVNPSIGQLRAVNTIQAGKPQPARYVLQTKSWPEPENGKGFAIAWWIDTDGPMKSLAARVAEKLSPIQGDSGSLSLRIKVEGKSLRGSDKSWFMIDNASDGTMSGTFGGQFEVENEITIENMGKERDVVVIENGRFTVPISELFVQE